MLPNVPYFPVVYYGVLRAGGVVVPMNVLLKGREVAFYLEDSGAKLLFAWHEFDEAAQSGAEEAGAEVIDVKPGEFEQLVDGRRAGSRRRRRGGRRHRGDPLHLGHHRDAEGRRAHARQPAPERARSSIGLGQFTEDDVVLGALPLFHSFGQTCSMNTTILGGGRLTLIPRFDPVKALEIIERDKVTIFQGVPTMYVAMLHHPKRDAYDTSSLRLCFSGGSAMPVEVHARLRGGVRLQDPRGLRPVGDLAGGVVQPSRPRAQARLDRHADRGRRDEGRRRGRQRGRPGRGRRDRHPRPQRDEGLLEAAGRHRGGHARTAGSTPATWPRSTRTATSSSSTARRT